MKQVNAKFS